MINWKLRALLAKGYLPKELVPNFSSKDFADFYSDSTNFPRIQKPPNPPQSEPSKYPINRAGGHYRVLHVPNPFHIGPVAVLISSNLSEFLKRTGRSKNSLSRPRFNPSHSRIFEPVFSQTGRKRREALLRANGRYVLKLDIKEFYPSLYTHAIAWAISPQSRLKRNWRNQRMLGNKVDNAFRMAQSRRSVGVPIGPDLSFLIAEVVLCKVDANLKKHKIKYLRWYDDFSIVCNSIEEAETIKTTIGDELSNFNLSINSRKTAINELPHAIEHEWRDEMRTYSLSDNVFSVQGFFDLAFRYAKLYPDENVLNYCVGRLFVISEYERNINLVLANLSQCVLAERGCCSKFVSLVAHWIGSGIRFEVDVIEELANRLAVRIGQNSAVNDTVWILSLIIHMRIRLNPASVKALNKNKNPFLAIICMHALHEGLLNGFAIKFWQEKVKSDELYGPDWIAIYEGVRHGWLKDPNNIVQNDSQFGHLLTEDVEFYVSNLPLFRLFLNPIGPPKWVQKAVSERVKEALEGKNTEDFRIPIPSYIESENRVRIEAIEIEIAEIREMIEQLRNSDGADLEWLSELEYANEENGY
jgi:hypothetical protein